MTTNQLRAASLAEAIQQGWTDAADLLDHDWHLLLLAAGVNRCHAPPIIVATRVLTDMQARAGYFSSTSGSTTAEPLADGLPFGPPLQLKRSRTRASRHSDRVARVAAESPGASLVEVA